MAKWEGGNGLATKKKTGFSKKFPEIKGKEAKGREKREGPSPAVKKMRKGGGGQKESHCLHTYVCL